jgi:hypothetical protein
MSSATIHQIYDTSKRHRQELIMPQLWRRQPLSYVLLYTWKTFMQYHTLYYPLGLSNCSRFEECLHSTGVLYKTTPALPPAVGWVKGQPDCDFFQNSHVFCERVSTNPNQCHNQQLKHNVWCWRMLWCVWSYMEIQSLQQKLDFRRGRWIVLQHLLGPDQNNGFLTIWSHELGQDTRVGVRCVCSLAARRATYLCKRLHPYRNSTMGVHLLTCS